MGRCEHLYRWSSVGMTDRLIELGNACPLGVWKAKGEPVARQNIWMENDRKKCLASRNKQRERLSACWSNARANVLSGRQLSEGCEEGKYFRLEEDWTRLSMRHSASVAGKRAPDWLAILAAASTMARFHVHQPPTSSTWYYGFRNFLTIKFKVISQCRTQKLLFSPTSIKSILIPA